MDEITTTTSYHSLPLELRLQILSQLPLSTLLGFLTNPVSKSWEQDIHCLFRTKTFQVTILNRVQAKLMASHSEAVKYFLDSNHDSSDRDGCDAQVRTMMILISLVKWVSTMSRVLDRSTEEQPLPTTPPSSPHAITPPCSPSNPQRNGFVDAKLPFYQTHGVGAVSGCGGKAGRKRRRSSLSISAILGKRPVLDRRWGCTCSLFTNSGLATRTDVTSFDGSEKPGVMVQESQARVGEYCSPTVGVRAGGQDVDEEEVLKELVTRCRIASTGCLDVMGARTVGCLWTHDLRRIIYPSSRYDLLDA